jgi:hypothetical protein
MDQLGPDTYMVAGGIGIVGSRAEQECARQGKKILVTNIRSAGEFIFRCLDPSDPAYQNPVYEKEL